MGHGLFLHLGDLPFQATNVTVVFFNGTEGALESTHPARQPGAFLLQTAAQLLNLPVVLRFNGWRRQWSD
jgi:hypothetical protein